MQSNMDDIRGKKIKGYSDNKNVQSIMKIGSKKEALQTIAVEVSEIYDKIYMSVEWIPRHLNERADYLSRCKDSDDWSIQEWVFSTIDQNWGHIQLTGSLRSIITAVSVKVLIQDGGFLEF